MPNSEIRVGIFCGLGISTIAGNVRDVLRDLDRRPEEAYEPAPERVDLRAITCP
jgi:hypothetical protein